MAMASIEMTRRRAEPTRSTFPGRLDESALVTIYFLVAELVLLGDQLALLVLEARHVVRGLRDLGCDREVEEQRDEDRADADVGVAENAHVEPFGCNRSGGLDETARAPSPPGWGGDVRRGATRAEAPSGQYSGRCQDVCYNSCWMFGSPHPRLRRDFPACGEEASADKCPAAGGVSRPLGLGGVRFFPRPGGGRFGRGGWRPPPLRRAALDDG